MAESLDEQGEGTIFWNLLQRDSVLQGWRLKSISLTHVRFSIKLVMELAFVARAKTLA